MKFELHCSFFAKIMCVCTYMASGKIRAYFDTPIRFAGKQMFSTLERNIFDVVTYMAMSQESRYHMYKFVFKTFKSLLKVEWL
jgi:hypothetical protein